MKKFLFLACILVLGWTQTGFCLDLKSQVSLLKYEINKWEGIKDKEKTEKLKPMIEANINCLTDSINLKIKKYESDLIKIEKHIQNCNTDSEAESGSDNILVEKHWKKFYSKQKKVTSLNDLLLTIEQLKLQVTQ